MTKPTMEEFEEKGIGYADTRDMMTVPELLKTIARSIDAKRRLEEFRKANPEMADIKEIHDALGLTSQERNDLYALFKHDMVVTAYRQLAEEEVEEQGDLFPPAMGGMQ